MYCIHCGRQIEDGSRFCKYCGQRQQSAEEPVKMEPTPAPAPEPAPQPAPKAEPEMVPCIHCGRLIRADKRFCIFCGMPQTKTEPAKEQKPEPEPEPAKNETVTEEAVPQPKPDVSQSTPEEPKAPAAEPSQEQGPSPEPGMVPCVHCGKLIKAGTPFCIFCGTPQPKTEPKLEPEPEPVKSESVTEEAVSEPKPDVSQSTPAEPKAPVADGPEPEPVPVKNKEVTEETAPEPQPGVAGTPETPAGGSSPKQESSPVPGMVPCVHCGKLIKAGIPFCIFCGMPQPKTAPSPEQKTEPAKNENAANEAVPEPQSDVLQSTPEEPKASAGGSDEQTRLLDNDAAPAGGAAPGMVPCIHCGKLIQAGSPFCTYCGKPQTPESGPKPGSSEGLVPCIHCGKLIKAGSPFCTYCGTSQTEKQTPERKTIPVRHGVSHGTSHGAFHGSSGKKTHGYGYAAKRKTKSSTTGIIAIVVVAIAAAAVLVLCGLWFLDRPQVSLNSELVIECEGYDGDGTARAVFDMDVAKSAYEDASDPLRGILHLNSDDFSSKLGDLLGEDAVNAGSLDKTSGLSNGDVVTWTWTLDKGDLKSLENSCHVDLTYRTIEQTVDGLSTMAQVDPFRDLVSVSFSGDDGDGTAEVSCSSDSLADLVDITADPSTGLSNGDTVTVTISLKDQPDAAPDEINAALSDALGETFTGFTKDYTVDGLGSVDVTLDMISSKDLNKLKKNAVSVIEDAFPGDGDAEKYVRATYAGDALMTAVDGNSTEVPYLFDMVYLVRMTDADLDGDKLTEKTTFEFLAVVEADGITVSNGKVTVDPDSLYLTGQDFTALVGGDSNEDDQPTSYTYTGYTSWDALNDDLFEGRKKDYTAEIDTDSSKEPMEPEAGTDKDDSSDIDYANEDEEEVLSQDYIIPDSDSKYLTDADIEGMTIREINYAKNEIYARHGRKFKSKELQNYFNSKDWYNGTIAPENFKESSLNKYEAKNASFLATKEFSMNPKGYQLDQNN